MIPDSPILNFQPMNGIDYTIETSGEWTIHTKDSDKAMIIIRKFLDDKLTEKHTLRIVDTGYLYGAIDILDTYEAIDVIDTYESVWSAMDVIGVCLMREDARIRWIGLEGNQVTVGMCFKKHKLPFGFYAVVDGKLGLIENIGE